MAMTKGKTLIMAKSIFCVLKAYDVQTELQIMLSNKYEKDTDSTLYIYSYFGLFHTPMKVGRGVMANKNTESLPDVLKKSKNLFTFGISGICFGKLFISLIWFFYWVSAFTFVMSFSSLPMSLFSFCIVATSFESAFVLTIDTVSSGTTFFGWSWLCTAAKRAYYVCWPLIYYDVTIVPVCCFASPLVFSAFYRSFKPLMAASAFLINCCFFISLACSSNALIWFNWSI